MTITIVATLSAIFPVAAQRQQPNPRPVPSAKVASSASVTLLTGDVVRMTTYTDGRRQTMMLGPDGSPGRNAMTYGNGKHLYVVPTEVLPYLRTGKLDEHLFDVAGLVEQGYGDSSSPSLPVIITYADGVALDAQTWLSSTVTEPPRTLSSVDGIAATVDKKRIRSLWEAVSTPDETRLANGIERIWLDGRVHVSLEDSVPMVGAPQAWEQGYDGRGVTVAVVDTGVDATHPDLAGKVTAAENFTPRPNANDEDGHGTHVAATVAGTGKGSDGRRRGVAPGASIISARTIDNTGWGDLSWIIAGMQWAAKHADVINISLGAYGPADGTDLWSQSVNELTASTGVLFVIAAGNAGPDRSTVEAPGAAEAALTVGNVTKSDELANRSGRGPRLGDNAVKPEITAPGTNIVAARAKDTAPGTPVDNLYTSLSGTSQATPHVAGAAAILAQRHPDWTAEQLKSALAGSARPNPGLGVFEQGAGRLDVPRALNQTLLTSPTTLTFGFLKWPNQNQPPITRTLSYRNTATTPVTLDLAASATHEPDHAPVPDGVLSLSTRKLTIPPGNTADVLVTVNPRAVASGDLGGTVVATDRANGNAARTPLSLGVEPEHHDLTVRAIGRDGRPATAWVELSTAGDDKPRYFHFAGSEVVRLPKAEYSVMAFVIGADGPVITELTVGGDPEVLLDRDTTVTVDIRTSHDVEVRVPDRDAKVRGLLVAWSRSFSTAEPLNSPHFLFQQRIPRVSVIPSDRVTHGQFEFVTGWRMMAPELRLLTDHAELAAEPAWGSPRLTGRRQLAVVDAGAGRPGDFATARGALALVAGGELSPMEQAANAAKAGARGLLIPDDALGRPPDTAWGAPIPVIALSGAAADQIRELIRKGGARLDVDGAGHSPYVYNLMLPSKQTLPAAPRYTVRRDELATVTNTFYGVAPGRPAWEALDGWRPAGLGNNHLAGVSDITEPLTRREYLSGGETLWMQSVQVPSPNPVLVPVMHSGIRSYRPGEKRDQTWWKGPLTPSNSSYTEDPTIVSGREGDQIQLRMGDYRDAEPDHWGQPFNPEGSDETVTVRVLRDGRLLYEGPIVWGDYQVGPEPSTYRVEHTVNRAAPWFTTSKRTSTTWTFRSARPSKPGVEALPLINADWSLNLGLRNDTPEFIPQPFRLKVAHLPGAPVGPVTRVNASVSYDDGKKWYPLGLHRDGTDSYRGALLHPPHWYGTGWVSLRVNAVDAAGNRVDQTIERAYKITSW